MTPTAIFDPVVVKTAISAIIYFEQKLGFRGWECQKRDLNTFDHHFVMKLALFEQPTCRVLELIILLLLNATWVGFFLVFWSRWNGSELITSRFLRSSNIIICTCYVANTILDILFAQVLMWWSSVQRSTDYIAQRDLYGMLFYHCWTEPNDFREHLGIGALPALLPFSSVLTLADLFSLPQHFPMRCVLSRTSMFITTPWGHRKLINCSLDWTPLL